MRTVPGEPADSSKKRVGFLGASRKIPVQTGDEHHTTWHSCFCPWPPNSWIWLLRLASPSGTLHPPWNSPRGSNGVYSCDNERAGGWVQDHGGLRAGMLPLLEQAALDGSLTTTRLRQGDSKISRRASSGGGKCFCGAPQVSSNSCRLQPVGRNLQPNGCDARF